VQTVEGVALHVMGELGSLAYAGNDGKLMGFHFKVYKSPFYNVQYGKVAAARAPCRFLSLILF
jgi:hypothetical protein